jgi:hypothetical protein
VVVGVVVVDVDAVDVLLDGLPREVLLLLLLLLGLLLGDRHGLAVEEVHARFGLPHLPLLLRDVRLLVLALGLLVEAGADDFHLLIDPLDLLQLTRA